MARLEDLKRGALVLGLHPSGPVTVVDVTWHGTAAIELFYTDAAGQPAREVLYRDREPLMTIVTSSRGWSVDVDGNLLRLASEALRIRLAHLFDPLLAVHTSLVEPLPHQITAVYEEMLTRQPLRFLLADDPGAGKTIMAGLLIRELIARGDVEKCLIVCPGSLTDQWQDELETKFHLPFDLVTSDRIESARSGNVFQEMPFAIARLDKLSRNEDLQAKLAEVDWDLIICDEAHKMSASYFSGEVKETGRYKLGKLLASKTRHFLLMTATPHNGKETDFQLFLALLDGDRFEGKFRDGVHMADVSDLMRRMAKEQLVKFDGTPLFPERQAHSPSYKLSEAEAALYKQVTSYVRQEWDRADKLDDERRRGTVGFALTALQRRLASSPEAIYQSLHRRRERLEQRVQEERLLKRGSRATIEISNLPSLTEDDIDELDDAPGQELESLEQRVMDEGTAARTIAELEAELATLRRLEEMALAVRRSGTDRKWEELRGLLQDKLQMFDAEGHRRKLVVFTESRDTLNYLTESIRTLLGKPEAVAVIHGGIGREDRRKAQESFTQDREVSVLVATDAAGEGINLQRAHLMVNYDLPWNPNRLEQRFGRIHRIGQTEVCHMWNLVAAETREGEVFNTLLRKLEFERKALGAGVFDVLGKAIDGVELRRLMIDAIRYGDQPEVRARLTQTVEGKLDHDHLQALLDDKALVHEAMDTSRLRHIREEMDRAEARRLQPHFIGSFFMEAFRHLGGTMREREPRRHEISHVPAAIRNRDRQVGRGVPVLRAYERITFEKKLVNVPGKPQAALICPGHPLLDATLDLILERYRPLLKQGGILIDDSDFGQDVRALVYLEHAIQDGRADRAGNRRTISRRLQFLEIGADGRPRDAGPAPYLDYRAPTEEEARALALEIERAWGQGDPEPLAMSYAIERLVPDHLSEVRKPREELVAKSMAAVKERLEKEIAHWDHRAQQLKLEEAAGKVNARVNSAKAQERANELERRLQARMEELEQQRRISALAPTAIGSVLVVPAGLLARVNGPERAAVDDVSPDKKRVEMRAMQAVMAIERALGHEPRDVSERKCGYDVESRMSATGRLRFIEVKGRITGADSVSLTRNEILTSRNKPEGFILALVEVPEVIATGPVGDVIREVGGVYGDQADGCRVRYVRGAIDQERGFQATSETFALGDLLAQSEAPS